jgi:hypothetical protein
MTPPKPLTPDERAAVDAAIAAGKLQRIPLGVYAEGVDNPVPLREQIRRQANAGKARVAALNTQTAKLATERRAAAQRLHGEGLTPQEIAGRLNVSRNVVYGYLNGRAA